MIPKKIVHLSYGIAITYVLGDCIDKGKTTYQVWHVCAIHIHIWSVLLTYVYLQTPELVGGHQIVPTLKKTGDVFLWQMFASVIIPGIVINRITWGAGKLVKNAKISNVARKWLPTCIGLVAIPFIIKPIDIAVDRAMDRTYRKYV